MDPQATWDDLLAAYAEGDWERVQELAEALDHWLSRGGFPPRAVTGTDLGSDWDHAIVDAACGFARKHARRHQQEGGAA